MAAAARLMPSGAPALSYLRQNLRPEAGPLTLAIFGKSLKPCISLNSRSSQLVEEHALWFLVMRADKQNKH